MPVQGRPEFEAALADLVARVQEGAQAAARDAAHLIEAGAKERVPVLTGSLRRSIMTWVSQDDRAAPAFSVAPTLIYGRRIELGFEGPDSLGRIYRHDPGHPYLKPAVQAALPNIGKVIQSRLIAAIRG